MDDRFEIVPVEAYDIACGAKEMASWGSHHLAESDDLAEFFSIADKAERDTARKLYPTLGATSVILEEAAKYPDKTYRIVGGGVTPIKGSDGLYHGVEWRSGSDGKGMREMAKLKEVGNVAKLASTFFSQGMLIYIAAELNDIKQGIKEIQNELFESEVSKMKGLIDAAGSALRRYGRNGDNDILNNAIQPLSGEILPLQDAIVRQVRRMPTKTSLFGAGKATIKASYDEVISAAIWLLKGVVTLCLLYSVNDPEFGRKELTRFLDRLNGCVELSEWLSQSGRTLSFNGYGEKYFNDAERLRERVSYQRKVLAAPSDGLLLTGRQLIELKNCAKVSLSEGRKERELVQVRGV